MLLYPKNECGKYKFICTTVRPTKVPYPELYEYEKCAKFISEFLEYEELNPPTELPKFIPAPDNVIQWQIGDSFDYSIVLCSLLIGSGYNAYVVYGKAPRYITTKDESTLICLDLPDDIKIIEPDLSEKEENADIEKIENKQPIESELEKAEYNEKERKKNEEWIKNNVIDDDQGELERHDPYLHKRLHAWVLLKKNKRISQDIFIEPSTGRIYDPKSSPYETIDSIFNNFNYWINLSPELPANVVDLNLKNNNLWEFVMLNGKDNNEDILDEEGNEDNFNTGINTAGLNKEFDEQAKEDEELEKHILDMPPPWPNQLYISRYAYNNRTPLSTQTFYYSKTRVDKFSPYTQPDGITLRIFKYKDYARHILDEIEYRYRNRMDKLYKKLKRPYEHKVIDFYLPGQKYGWKQVEEVESVYKKVFFYQTNYSSGLIYREEIFGKKIIHQYISRDDRVIERKVRIDKDYKEKMSSYKNFFHNPFYSKCILITKFTQKFLPNPLIPVN